jgi:hypothetical protein
VVRIGSDAAVGLGVGVAGGGVGASVGDGEGVISADGVADGREVGLGFADPQAPSSITTAATIAAMSVAFMRWVIPRWNGSFEPGLRPPSA